MAETNKSRLSSPPETAPAGNGVSGGGESGFHPQQMQQQFSYSGKFQSPSGLHHQRPVMVSYEQHAVFQQQPPYAHHVPSYQQLPHQQQQQLQYQQQQRQQLQQQQQMQFIQQPVNLQHPMQYIKETQKSSLSQSQQHLESSDLDSQDEEESSASLATIEVKPDKCAGGETAKDASQTPADVRTPAEMEKLSKELEAVRAAHEKQVRELEAKIKALEEKKSQKEVKYLRVKSSKSKNARGKSNADGKVEAMDTSEGPGEVDILESCPSPVLSVHSIKEEPDDDDDDVGIRTRAIQKSFFMDSDEDGDNKDDVDQGALFGRQPRKNPEFWQKPNVNEVFLRVKNKEIGMKTAAEELGCTYGFTYSRYREVYGNLVKDVQDDKDDTVTKIATSAPEYIPPKTYTLSVTDFDFCIFCQTVSEKKMTHVTEENLPTLQSIILNVECEASCRLKDYVFDNDMFLNNLPQYHSDCQRKFKVKLQIIRKKRKNLEETDFSLCIFCQEHRNEPLYNLTSKSIVTVQRDLNKLDDEKIEKLKNYLNFDRIKNLVEVESTKEEISSNKLIFHRNCRYKFITKDRPRKHLKNSTSELENKEDSVEITPDEDIFELLAQRQKKCEKEKQRKQRKELPEPNEFDFKTKCVLCGVSAINKKITLKNTGIQKIRGNAEKNQHFDIIKILEYGVDFDKKLLCHQKCYKNYNWARGVITAKKGTLEHYEIAFKAVITEIEEPLFRNGKVFSLVELREKFLKKLMEFKIESNQEMNVFIKRIKNYYTFNSKCRVTVLPYPDHFLYSYLLNESQAAPQINAFKKNKENEGFLCSKCDYKCYKKRSLRNHMKKHEVNDETVNLSKVMCEVCGKMVRNNQSLKIHLRMHSGEKYYCLQCDKTYLSKASLDNHTLIHTGEKNIECPDCGKKFLIKDYLKKHREMVHGNKSFLCSVCSKSFKTNKRLKEHSRKHSDDKPFLCKECGKAFKYRSVRRTHELSHKGQKPQMCSLCSFGCYTKAHLKIHMAVHAGSNEQIMYSNNGSEDEKHVSEKYIQPDEIPDFKTQTYFPL